MIHQAHATYVILDDDIEFLDTLNLFNSHIFSLIIPISVCSRTVKFKLYLNYLP